MSPALAQSTPQVIMAAAAIKHAKITRGSTKTIPHRLPSSPSQLLDCRVISFTYLAVSNGPGAPKLWGWSGIALARVKLSVTSLPDRSSVLVERANSARKRKKMYFTTMVGNFTLWVSLLGLVSPISLAVLY